MTIIKLPARKKCPWCGKKPSLWVDKPGSTFGLCQAEAECKTVNCPVQPRVMVIELGQKEALLAVLKLWNTRKGEE